MAKNENTVKIESPRREEVLRTAREHILAAASLLRPLSTEFERVSWILEDTLMYIDEAEAEDIAGAPPQIQLESSTSSKQSGKAGK